MKNFLLCCCLLAPLVAWGQGCPAEPIRMIVPFPACGPADIFGRGLAQGPSAQLDLVVHAATPADIQKRLNAAAVAALKSPAEQEKRSKLVTATGFREQN